MLARLGMTALLIAAMTGALTAQGSYKVTPTGGSTLDVFLGTTPNTVWIDGVLQVGATWSIADYDGDTEIDDVIVVVGGGTAVLINGKAGTPHSTGELRDGPSGGLIGTWGR